MRVLHVIPSISPRRGGPSTAVMELAAEQNRRGHEVAVVTTDDDGPGRLQQPSFGPFYTDGVAVRYFPRQTHFYSVSLPLAHWLWRHVSDYDLVHVHALFSFPPLSASLIAHRRGVPYIIRPLGTLDRWGMDRRRPLLKRLSFRAIERPLLDRAAAVHFTSAAERDQSAPLGIRAPGFVIPLGASRFAPSDCDAIRRYQMMHRIPPGARIILFMSRFDPKKGLDLLLDAFARIAFGHPEYILVLAGGMESDLSVPLAHVAERRSVPLRSDRSLAGIVDRIRFVGFLQGAEKAAALACAEVFVLPSRSENFGLVAVEAMAAGLPVVVSHAVGIAADVEEAGAGLAVPLDPEGIARALAQLLDSPDLRRACSEKGRALASERFSVDAAVDRLDELYAGILRQC